MRITKRQLKALIESVINEEEEERNVLDSDLEQFAPKFGLPTGTGMAAIESYLAEIESESEGGATRTYKDIPDELINAVIKDVSYNPTEVIDLDGEMRKIIGNLMNKYGSNFVNPDVMANLAGQALDAYGPQEADKYIQTRLMISALLHVLGSIKATTYLKGSGDLKPTIDGLKKLNKRMSDRLNIKAQQGRRKAKRERVKSAKQSGRAGVKQAKQAAKTARKQARK